MAGFIDAAVQDIDNRLKELKEEEQRLSAARAALIGSRRSSGSSTGSSSGRRGPGRPARAESSGGASAGASTRRRGPGRPRGRSGGNTRSAQALQLVRNKPGITIPEIAAAMKIEPNYLYRVMPKLTADGLITRDGQGWHPAQQAES